MADVQWTKFGVVAILGAALPIFGCSSSSTNECAAVTPTDASTEIEMRPRPDTGGDAPASVNGALGSSCAAAADCQSGLSCIRATDNLMPGAGPSNGLCTKTCVSDANNSTCKPLGGSCVFFDADAANGYCVENCSLGNSAGAKCHNRPDVACESIATASGMIAFTACMPLCTDDADCGTRKCDLGTGYCADLPNPGAPPGGSCSKDGDCQGGFCFDVTESDAGPRAGACFSYCRYGGLEGCGYRRGPLTPGLAACVIPQSSMNAGDGDEGYCLALCDTDADCPVKTPGWGCVNVSQIRSTWGHGVCFFNAGAVQTDAGAPDAARVDAAAESSTRDAAAEAARTADADSSADAGVDATAE